MIADRHIGIGCDQILVIREPLDQSHAARYEIWNADGSPAGQCGNGARCIGLFLIMPINYPLKHFSLESPAGVIHLNRCVDGEFEIEMGIPDFSPASLPLNLTSENTVYHLDSPFGPLEFGAVSMGNPHALVLVETIGDENIPGAGAFIGAHPDFS